MTGAFIIGAGRTAVAPRGGGLRSLEIHELGAPVIKHCLKTAGIAADQVNELIVSNALGAGGNPARLAALAAGLPETIAGLTIDRQCCGGLDAINLATAMVHSGQAEVVVAGGIESYSRRPMRLRTFVDRSPAQPYDRPPFSPWPLRDPDMAEAANALATRMTITKDAQDNWAIQSHIKALASQVTLQDEIVAINGVDHDPFARNLTPRLCERAGAIAGTITTANTSIAADAAAFCIVVSEDVARQLIGPAIEIVAGVTVGGCPELPGIAPVAAIEKVLKASGLRANDLTVAEIMEAFAAQAIACITMSGLDPAITNLGGGSLARGHPIGASGAINAVRLFHELRRRGGSGITAIAAAGGIGTALALRA